MPPASKKQDQVVSVVSTTTTTSQVAPVHDALKKKVTKAKVAPSPEDVVVKETPATVSDVVVSETETEKVKDVVVSETEKVKDDVVANDDDNIIQNIVDKITSLSSLVKEIQNAIKPVIKEHERQKKIIEKIHKKRENAKKSPSGFAKPNKISDELCDFIGVPHGTEKSRTDITRHINSYVKENNLNKPTNRRVIVPDEKLKTILKINDGEEVTFFILQRLISHHFPPKQGTVVPH